MRRPSTGWQDEILEEQILEQLRSGIDTFDDVVCKHAKRFDEGVEGETPEFVAKTIGYMVYESNETDQDIETPVDSTDGSEGEKLAMGYIGVKGMEMAGVGCQVSDSECH